jgi:predicted nuclease with TOPRIM domain
LKYRKDFKNKFKDYSAKIEELSENIEIFRKENVYLKEKFEIDNNKIIKYNGIKKEYKFLDSKSIKWEYYERSVCG